MEDFLRFLCEEEAERAMALFEGASESDKISKSCLKNWVVSLKFNISIKNLYMETELSNLASSFTG